MVDTWLLLQLYDIAARDLDGYGLPEAGIYFGTLRDDSVLDTDDTAQRARISVEQVARIAELLSQSYFLQTQMLPYNYQDCVLRGNATKINALFLREYLRRRHTIPPVPDDYNTYEGGYTQIFEEGVISNIVHCDVASLYPSLMLVYRLAPRQDELAMFLPLLSDLRTFRLQAKRQALDAATPDDRHHYNALQQTFKIFINSFYGYLGTSFSNFADTAMAAEVTQKGRDLINQVIDELRRHGCRPIEIDTDGVYFVPPPGREGASVVDEISQALPTGLKLETDATYPAMFSHKTKNYALLTSDGELVIKGSGLKSRGVEKYLRDLTEEIIRRLLQGRAQELPGLYDELISRLATHQLPIRMLTKTETLSESLDSYQQKVQAKKRNAAAAYELALKTGRRMRPGDRVTYYVAGEAKKVRLFDQCKLVKDYARDENVAYYQQKAKETFERFLPYYPAESPLQARLGKLKAVQQELL
jgi:DNA polymerase elongation subunit (family B)